MTCAYIHNGYCRTNRRVCTPDIREHACPAEHGDESIRPRGGTFVGFPGLKIDRAIERKVRMGLRRWSRDDFKRIIKGIRKWDIQTEPANDTESDPSGWVRIFTYMQEAVRYMRATNKPEYKRPWSRVEARLIVAGIQGWNRQGYVRPVTQKIMAMLNIFKERYHKMYGKWPSQDLVDSIADSVEELTCGR
jgi:hypothetical protein